ncbi:hypothetical protein MSM1_03880 [Mycobacterium sp. SM1]|uniref:hypothetical protein n=1 Tax=Mycobacterium sp. SM1 TaxID=2816243 RepID=UPI001BCD679F|nr:hypothetical protein [Mycobacterium sp. SM1]MBS4727527.1 hypothetical protein [Mycobacterium sp. SM1]
MLAEPPELPSLPEVESASFQHYLDSTDYFRRAADWLEHTFTAARDAAQHPGGTEWQGQAQHADLETRQRDLQWVSVGAINPLRAGEKVCVAAFDHMTASRKTVLDAVQQVREAGFSVGPDYTVAYTGTVASEAEYEKRLEEAKQHRNYIRHRVAAMVAHDRDNAQKMDEALSALETFTFDEPKAGPDDKVVGEDDRKNVHPVDRTWKRDPAPGPDDPGRHPKYPDRKPNGEWAPGNSGVDGDLEAQRAFDDLEQQTGIPVDRQKIRVTLTDPNTGETLTRYYDGLQPIPGQPGKYLGLEHKLGAARLTPNQSRFDDLVKAGIPAQGTLNGDPIEVLKTRVMSTPNPLPPPAAGPPGAAPAGPGSTPMISAPRNLPPALEHPPIAPQLVQPGHHPSSPIPPTVLDHPPLPPWLQNPSPPGFDVHPSEPPLFAPLDQPDLPAAAGPTYTPPPSGPIISLPPISHEFPIPSGGRLAGVKMGSGRLPTPMFPWACEPACEFGAGARPGRVTHCCFEHAGQNFGSLDRGPRRPTRYGWIRWEGNRSGGTTQEQAEAGSDSHAAGDSRRRP